MGNYTIFRCLKILGEAGKQEFYNKCSENSRSQIVLRTDIFPKIVVGCPCLVEDSRLYLPSSYIRFTSETPGCCSFEGHKLNMATGKPAETNFVDTSLEELIKIKLIFIPSHGQTKSQKSGNLKTHIRAFPAAS